MSNITVTTGFVSSYQEGDILTITIYNSFWKVVWYWLLRKDLKRYTTYKIQEVNGTTLIVE